MCQDTNIKNGIVLTYMISPVTVTSLYLLIICMGRFVGALRTWDVPNRVVFSFRDPKFGPKMSSAARTSSRVTGQLGNS
jgi:hypothetical protein